MINKIESMNKLSFLVVLLLAFSGITAQEVIPLYNGSIPNSSVTFPKQDEPTVTVYLPNKPNGIAILIIPGGAYAFLATDTEGTPIAKAFAEKGITSFVLKYRLPSDVTMLDRSVGPLQDGQRALQIIRSRAKKWQLDTKKVGVIGFSAGGHLASSLETKFNKGYILNPDHTSLRPDFSILVYPVISMDNALTNIDSQRNLLGENASSETKLLWSSEEHVTKETPPTYLTHASDDEVVDVNNSVEMYKALQSKGVNSEMHLFSKGNHGFTQRLLVHEWMGPMLDFLKREGFYAK